MELGVSFLMLGVVINVIKTTIEYIANCRLVINLEDKLLNYFL